MTEELNLVHDLAVILISAGVFTIISRALKQPLILGYIVAGFLVGPHVGFFPGITSTESVNQWSEIGIIFLLFALGLEFSFKKLLKVGSTGLVMAGCQCLGMMSLGIMLGQAMDWETMESVFLGGMLSMSSTAIVIKAYDDLGLKNSPNASTVFGTLVVQDLIAILLMVILSTMAVSHSFSGVETVKGVGRLLFCLVLWFLVGIYVIPTALQRAHRYMTDEILLIISIGLCFGMVMIAETAGFSSALGAFVMGSIMSETVEGEKIMKLVGSIKNLFGAIFFVSVGMMLNPEVIAAHWFIILVITIFAMAGMSFFSTSGALLSGKGLDDAVTCGFSLAQIGEFSFILAGLGVSLGVMREFIYPVIIAVSVITTFLTPYMIKASGPFSFWLRKKLPTRMIERLEASDRDPRTSDAEHEEWVRLLKSQLVRMSLYCVVIIAIMFGCTRIMVPLIMRMLPDLTGTMAGIVKVAVTLVPMAPFLLSMVMETHALRESSQVLLQRNEANVWLLLSISLMKMAVAMVFIFMVIASSFTLEAWQAALVVLSAVLAFFYFIKRSYRHLYMIESRFMDNLNKKEELHRRKAPVTTSVNEKLSRYDIRSVVEEVSPDYPLIGTRLRNLPFRTECGVNIFKIIRGSRSIELPSGDERVYPYDKLVAVGTAEQLDRFVKAVRQAVPSAGSGESYFRLEKKLLDEESGYVGKMLSELDLRSQRKMVISVIRDGSPLTNPAPDFVFRAGDLVWIASGSDWEK